MDCVKCETPEELAAMLSAAASDGKTISLGGAFTKQAMAGPVAPADVRISTAGMHRILQYEPHDLTVSVEAGLPYSELERTLAANRQMVPLDPPFADSATIGGIVAANCSGPRRRLYGTARDMIIGMKFATLEGKLVQSGGMVVKNVAGLDMGKLMIGSFGTLAALAVINFKLVPMPALTRTFVRRFDSVEQAVEARDAILRGVLQPAALDLLNPPAAACLGRNGYLLLVQAGGNRATMERYSRELGESEEGDTLWRDVREFTPDYLAGHADGAVVRCSCTLSQVREVMAALEGPAVARAGSGVCYGYFPSVATAAEWVKQAVSRGWKAVIEFAPDGAKESIELWPCPGSDLATMLRIKAMLDPKHLLNRGRLYGRI